jgi:hypothetical protein
MHVRLGAVAFVVAVGLAAGSGVAPALVSVGHVPAAAAATSSAAADLAFVRWLSTKDPRQTVRVAARTAVISSAQDRAVAQFLATGYESAKSRAAAARSRNLDFARRVLAASVPEVSPEVHAAAEHAVNGTDTDRARFVAGEYAAAKERDRLARASDGARAHALMQADRQFVVGLRDSDPGEQVRAAAAWAVRTGSTDADVVEFFAYGWLTGASLDLEVHRIRLADSDAGWRSRVARLVGEAEAAERAANAAAQEGAAQARAAAARAWQAVGDRTAPARTAWAGAEAAALAQATNWQAVAAAALAAGGPNWTPIVGSATINQLDWSAERDTAAEQAQFWTGLLDQALAGERRMTGA